MKIIIYIVLFSIPLTLFSQKTYFERDTLRYEGPNASNVHPVIGEVWYLKRSEDHNTLIFSKEYFRESSVARFEFESSGQLYIEGGMLDCGEWGMDFFASFTIDKDKVTLLNPNNSHMLNELVGIFTIAIYTNNELKLIRSK